MIKVWIYIWHGLHGHLSGFHIFILILKETLLQRKYESSFSLDNSFIICGVILCFTLYITAASFGKFLVCLGAPPKKTLHNEFHWSLVIWLFAIYLDAPSNLTKKRKFLISSSGGKKYLFFGKFGGIFFLETPVLRFVLLSYYRRVLRYFAKYPSHWIVAELQWKKRSFFVLICF